MILLGEIENRPGIQTVTIPNLLPGETILIKFNDRLLAHPLCTRLTAAGSCCRANLSAANLHNIWVCRDAVRAHFIVLAEPLSAGVGLLG